MPALATKTVRYIALLARVPTDFGNVRDIEVDGKQVKIQGDGTGLPLSLPASGLTD